MRRFLRAVTTTAVALAIWLVASPARAAAPLCDTRGATTFAPAPTLQAPMASVDVGHDPRECPRADLLAAYRQGGERDPRIEERSPAPVAPVAAPRAVDEASAMRAPPDEERIEGARSGVHRSIERPPRRA